MTADKPCCKDSRSRFRIRPRVAAMNCRDSAPVRTGLRGWQLKWRCTRDGVVTLAEKLDGDIHHPRPFHEHAVHIRGVRAMTRSYKGTPDVLTRVRHVVACQQGEKVMRNIEASHVNGTAVSPPTPTTVHTNGERPRRTTSQRVTVKHTRESGIKNQNKGILRTHP